MPDIGLVERATNSGRGTGPFSKNASIKDHEQMRVEFRMRQLRKRNVAWSIEADARVKNVRMTMPVKLDWQWNSF